MNPRRVCAPVGFLPHKLEHACIARGIVIIVLADGVGDCSVEQCQSEGDGVFAGGFRYFIQKRLLGAGDKIRPWRTPGSR